MRLARHWPHCGAVVVGAGVRAQAAQAAEIHADRCKPFAMRDALRAMQTRANVSAGQFVATSRCSSLYRELRRIPGAADACGGNDSAIGTLNTRKAIMDATPLIDVVMYVTVGINFAVAAGLLATVIADRRSGPQAPARRLVSVGICQPAPGIRAARAHFRKRPPSASSFDAIGSAVHVPNCHKNAA